MEFFFVLLFCFEVLDPENQYLIINRQKFVGFVNKTLTSGGVYFRGSSSGESAQQLYHITLPRFFKSKKLFFLDYFSKIFKIIPIVEEIINLFSDDSSIVVLACSKTSQDIRKVKPWQDGGLMLLKITPTCLIPEHFFLAWQFSSEQTFVEIYQNPILYVHECWDYLWNSVSWYRIPSHPQDEFRPIGWRIPPDSITSSVWSSRLRRCNLVSGCSNVKGAPKKGTMKYN